MSDTESGGGPSSQLFQETQAAISEHEFALPSRTPNGFCQSNKQTLSIYDHDGVTIWEITGDKQIQTQVPKGSPTMTNWYNGGKTTILPFLP